jgi:hypothetical protein
LLQTMTTRQLREDLRAILGTARLVESLLAGE